MMNNTLKNQFNFSPGTTVIGKWHKNKYKLIKMLGAGANGVVYLAEGSGGPVALKMSDNTSSVTSEVNVLKAFSKVQGSSLGPSLLDTDDWETGRERVPFYIMEYIHGPDLLTFIQSKGHSWTGVLIVQLLKDLQFLHKEGWVFGDLKPENLIVTGPPNKIRYIDVGGTTRQGRAIKEFTEFFDRGYWGAGTRKADPAYDLFAVAMVMINIGYPRRFKKQGQYQNQIRQAAVQHPELRRYEKIIMKAVNSSYSNASEMRSELLKILTAQETNRAEDLNQPVKTTAVARNVNSRIAKTGTRRTKRKRRKAFGFFETVIILLVVSILYMLYIYEQVL